MKRFEDSPYFVTEYGDVYREGSSKPLLHDKSVRGYCRVTLSENGKTKRYFVHRLVAMLYIPNPENLPHINHIDNDPSNNHKDNLEWCTQSQNMIHCFKQGRCSNIIASNESKRLNDINAGIELAKKYGESFDHTYTKNNRRFIVNKCLHCDECIEFRSDTISLFFTKIFCKSCIKDEDIVCSYMRI